VLPASASRSHHPSDGISRFPPQVLRNNTSTSFMSIEYTDLGQAFWEYRSAKIASFACALYVTAVMTIFAHNVVMGSFICPLSRCPENDARPASTRTVVGQQRHMALIFVCMDAFVITFHLTHAVHPKYIITRFRRRVMGLHLVSGTLQCILGPTAWALRVFSSYEQLTTVLVKGIVVWCFIAHFTTAIFLARTPFGAVRVLLPAFIFVIGMYAYTLGELYNSTYLTIEENLLQWFIMTHIYVMNRVTFSVLTKLNILAEVRYTVSILLGAAVCAPASMGIMSVAFLYGAIIVFNITFFAVKEPGVHDPDKPRFYSAGGETTQAQVVSHFVHPEGVVFARSMRELGGDTLTSKQMAALVFNRLDRDQSGKVELKEIIRLLVSWGLPSYVGIEVFQERDVNGDGVISMEEFHDNFADVWYFAATIVLGQAEVEKTVNTDQRPGSMVKFNTEGVMLVGQL